MASWQEIEADAPEFAARVRELFQARKHKTMATLRADGSPRISGVETQIGEQVTFGSMAGSRKGADLARDLRVALHSPSIDPPEDDPGEWVGEAKIAGRAVATADGFRVDIAEVALTYLGGGVPANTLPYAELTELVGWNQSTRTHPCPGCANELGSTRGHAQDRQVTDAVTSGRCVRAGEQNIGSSLPPSADPGARNRRSRPAVADALRSLAWAARKLTSAVPGSGA